MVAETFPVVISDMRMPLIDGARFLKLAREHAPDTVRILLTGQSTLDDAVATVNDGQIFRFLLKPCATGDLITAIDAAVSHHHAAASRRLREEQLLDGVLHALTAMSAAVDPTARERGDRVRRSAVDLAAALKIKSGHEIGLACELLQLGAIGLPRDTLAQLASHRPVNAEQGAELERLPEAAAAFLSDIPRMGSAHMVLNHLAQPFAPTRPGSAGTPVGARIARIALDYDVLQAAGDAGQSAARLDARARSSVMTPRCSTCSRRLWRTSGSALGHEREQDPGARGVERRDGSPIGLHELAKRLHLVRVRDRVVGGDQASRADHADKSGQ